MAGDDHVPLRPRTIVAALLVLGVVAAVSVLLLRGSTSEEEAVRAWFQSPAGGSMPEELAPSIHVGTCDFTDEASGGRPGLRCPVTTDAPTPILHTCFVISEGKAVQGGWQLTGLDACNALRFDPRTRRLVDAPARARYRVTER